LSTIQGFYEYPAACFVITGRADSVTGELSERLMKLINAALWAFQALD